MIPTSHLGIFAVAAVVATTAGCLGESEQHLGRAPVSPAVGGPTNGFHGGGPGGGGSVEVLPPFAPAPVQLRKLLGWQYRAAIRALLGNEASIVVTPPPDAAVNGFDAIGAAQLSVSSQTIAQYETSAFAAVQAGLADASIRAKLLPCSPAGATDAACYRTVIQTFGRKAFRRPLTEAEVSSWIAIAVEAGEAYGSFQRGVEFVLAGIIQAPSFLYMSELGEPDPADPTRHRLTAYELATRLSFFLTGTLPDDALLAAADEGLLHTVAGLRAQAARLVEKPEAREALGRFFDEALQLRDVETVVKDPTAFPEFSPALAKAMRRETMMLLEDVVWTRNADFRDVFDATYTFVTPELATLYGLDAEVPAGTFTRVELDPSGARGGFLGHAAFLSLMAHPISTSPTHRGKFIRERLLCTAIPAPPDEVDTSGIESPGTGPMTMRDRLMEHQTNPSCSGCHVMMDNMGLGLENFDALGKYREVDHGLPIDPVSTYDNAGSFAGALELGRKLREDARVTSCVVRSVYRMAVGHVDTEGETAPLRAAEKAFAASGYRMKALLVELAASDAFRYVSAQEVQP